jgi:conjugal transfer pilus assembly protein TraK
MLVAMAADRPPADIRVDEVNRPIQLWQEAKFALVRLFEGRGLVGEFGDLPVSELRAIAADRGLDVPKGTKKAELVALLEAAQPPEPDAEDPDAEPGAGGDELE